MRTNRPGTFVARWSNTQAALIGFRAAQGRTTPAIADELGNGIMNETVRAMLRRWQLPAGAKDAMQVPLSKAHRGKLARMAEEAGKDPEELASELLRVVINDDLTKAILG